MYIVHMMMYIVHNNDYIRSPSKPKIPSCIDACNACAKSCEFCATSCLREQDVKMFERCIQLDRECASICYTASQIMSMDGEHVTDVCRVCADICDTCGQKCEKHKQMDHCPAATSCKYLLPFIHRSVLSHHENF